MARAVTMQILRVRLVGTAPLLMHCGRLADPLDELSRELARFTVKRRKSIADHHRIADLEVTGGLWLEEGRPCIPAEAIEASICQAAARRRAKALFRSAVAVQANAILEYPGPDTVAGLVADPTHRLRVGVSVNGRRVMRTRPLFPTWSTIASIGYLPSAINRSDLIDVLMVAGDQIGLGDFRPRYGKFSVVKADPDATAGLDGVPVSARHG